MKRFIFLSLLLALCLPVQQVSAQDKPQDKPKTEEHAKPAIPIKVQIVVTELDGDKKISTMPYNFLAIADENVTSSYGPSSTSLRMGVRIPIEVEGKDQKTTYIDVGSNIDCGIRSEEDGRYRVYMVLERSSLYPNKSSDGERMVSEPNGQPLIRQFRTSENLILKDGQTSEGILSTDPLNGHVLRISVTINVQK
jgi:hypothetical protein